MIAELVNFNQDNKTYDIYDYKCKYNVANDVKTFHLQYLGNINGMKKSITFNRLDMYNECNPEEHHLTKFVITNTNQ